MSEGWVAPRWRATVLGTLGLVFVYAGVMKSIDPQAFLSDIQGFRILPYIFAVAVSLYLPWVEIVSGVAVFYGPLRQGAWWILVGLTWIFLIALLSVWLRGLDVSCGCFGKEPQRSQYLWWVTRDLGLLVGFYLSKPLPR